MYYDSSLECVDFEKTEIKVQCEKWKRAGECQNNRPKMFDKCPQHCRFCGRRFFLLLASSSPSSGYFTPHCVCVLFLSLLSLFCTFLPCFSSSFILILIINIINFFLSFSLLLFFCFQNSFFPPLSSSSSR